MMTKCIYGTVNRRGYVNPYFKPELYLKGFTIPSLWPTEKKILAYAKPKYSSCWLSW